MTTENGVYLLIDNELRQVREYNNEPDAKVVVVYQGTAVVISPKNFGEDDYHKAKKIAETNRVKLGNRPDWAIVDSKLKEVNEALYLLGHDYINGAYWTSEEYANNYACYYISYGILLNNLTSTRYYVRPLHSFSLDALKTK